MTGYHRRSRPPTRELRLAEEVARLVLALAGRLQDNYAAHAADLGLTAGQSKVLMALSPGEWVPMRELADRIRSDPSNLTGLVDKLEARGVLVRVPDRLDRRVKALVLTERGEQLRTDFWTRLSGDAGPLSHLSGGQLTALRDALLAAVPSPAAGDGRGADGSRGDDWRRPAAALPSP
jgi:DNA-binding MarR family transcriptional regulator